jgi:predicted component of type VI protein secretion system
MNRVITLAACAALLVLSACDDKKAETKPEDPSVKNATTTTTATASAATTAAAPVAINDGDLSTPADFEESAEKAISKANYKAELATLEGDIAKD